MFILKGNCDRNGQDVCFICESNMYQAPNGTCVACQVANCLECPFNPTCDRCKPGLLQIQNACLNCPSTVPSNAVFMSPSGPICVDRTSETFNQGYGVVVGQIDYRLIQACQVAGCRSCSENREVCSNCKPDHLFLLGKCVLCPTNFSNAILTENGIPKCVDRTTSLYSQGYGLVASQLSYQQIEKCTDSGCQSCFQNSAHCTACYSGYVLYTNKCIQCPQSFQYAILAGNQPVCVDRTIAPFVQGFGVDVSEPNIRLITTCAIHGCQNCFDDSKKCTGCLADHILYLSQCTFCPRDGKNALVVQNDLPICVDRTSPAYESAFGLDLTNPSFPLINTCQISGCLKCTSNRATCEKCPHAQGTSNPSPGEVYTECKLPKPPTASAATTASLGLSTGQFVVTRFLSQNSVKIAFLRRAQTSNLSVEVRDLVKSVTYSGSEVGAKVGWPTDSLLELDFESPVSVLKGELLIYLPGTASQTGTLAAVAPSRNRLLAADGQSQLIVVGDFGNTQTH